MNYVPIPVALLALGRPLPIDIWDAGGKLLARRGHVITTAQQKQQLEAHRASMTEVDARAWQRSYERMVRALLQEGAGADIVARAPMPSQILESDYTVAQEMSGGWLDLQEVLRGILYQGDAAANPLERLMGIEAHALELLRADTDECLFTLFQALAEPSFGYCATHALLSAAVCELVAEKTELPETGRRSLFRAALVMNIGMARQQDIMATQEAMPSPAQRSVVNEHPQRGVQMLKNIGVVDADQLDIVRWHHSPEEAVGLPVNMHSRRILQMADSLVAKTAARRTRLAMSPMSAVKSMYAGASGHAPTLVSAAATAIGFYPPGTYVQLVSGEKAVVVARGARANEAHVISIVNAGGLPLGRYVYRDTLESRFAIRAPVNPERIKLKLNPEQVQKAWNDRLGGSSRFAGLDG